MNVCEVNKDLVDNLNKVSNLHKEDIRNETERKYRLFNTFLPYVREVMFLLTGCVDKDSEVYKQYAPTVRKYNAITVEDVILIALRLMVKQSKLDLDIEVPRYISSFGFRIVSKGKDNYNFLGTKEWVLKTMMYIQEYGKEFGIGEYVLVQTPCSEYDLHWILPKKDIHWKSMVEYSSSDWMIKDVSGFVLCIMLSWLIIPLFAVFYSITTIMFYYFIYGVEKENG